MLLADLTSYPRHPYCGLHRRPLVGHPFASHPPVPCPFCTLRATLAPASPTVNACHQEKKTLDPSQIPNIQFGIFGLRHQLRIFFPRLWHTTERSDRQVSRDKLAQFYTLCVQKAAEHVIPDIIHGWPASLHAAQFKDQTARGMSNSGYLIPGYDLHGFSHIMRLIVAEEPELSWALDYVWGTEIRGVKDAFPHRIDTAPADIQECLDGLLENLDTTTGTWWIDVGVEFCGTNRCYQWTTDRHLKLIRLATGLNEQRATRLMNTRLYVKHVASHLLELSGFALGIAPSRGGQLDVAYVQAYTTDKSQTYSPSRGNFGKSISPRMALSGNPPRFCQDLISLYGDAATHTDVATRLEIRVPLQYARTALINIQWTAVTECIISMPRRIWW